MTKILDCTIRDGGHLNGWNFDNQCVLDSYNAAINAGIDYFEIGYRLKNLKSDFGEFAKCSDKMLFKLFGEKPDCKLSVMINASNANLNDFSVCKPEFTPISVVRVATYSNTLDEAFSLCEGLKAKNYDVFLNLMAISNYKKSDFLKLSEWENKNILETLYFADSFGSFYPNDVQKYHSILNDLGFSNLSFHSHNNLQLAFANSIEAVNLGIYSLDASIYGMGRSAGNLPIELILDYLNKSKSKNYNLISYLKVIKKYYEKLAHNFHWGYDLTSLTGGLKNIHPLYSKALFSEFNEIEKIYENADFISNSELISFDKVQFEKVLGVKNV